MEEERWDTLWFILLHQVGVSAPEEMKHGQEDGESRGKGGTGGRMDRGKAGRQRDGGEEVGMDRRIDWRKRGMKGWTDKRK